MQRLGTGTGHFLAKKLVEYLNPQKVTLRHGGKPMILINGKRLTSSEIRSLYRWKSGECKTVMTTTVDAWATRFDLPLWEIEEKAGRMIT